MVEEEEKGITVPSPEVLDHAGKAMVLGSALRRELQGVVMEAYRYMDNVVTNEDVVRILASAAEHEQMLWSELVQALTVAREELRAEKGVYGEY